MTARVTALWRHPIKGVGREEVHEATFTPGQTMPGDRLWAVAHEAAETAAETGDWAMCRNFLRAAGSPKLMAVSAAWDEETGRVTLTHPERETLSVDPDADAAALLDWLAPLVAEGRPAPRAVVRAGARGFTDSPLLSVTLCNAASHRAVEGRVGRSLSPHRWRGNVWLDGLAPWEEFDWEGREVRIGGAVFAVRERTGRCRATEANPETGRRDTDTLGALESWGHTDFSVQAECVAPGAVRPGDPVEVLP